MGWMTGAWSCWADGRRRRIEGVVDLIVDCGVRGDCSMESESMELIDNCGSAISVEWKWEKRIGDEN